MSNLPEQIKKRPVKAALVPVLAVVLLRVLFSGGDDDSSTPVAIVPEQPINQQIAEPRLPQPPRRKQRVWPQLAVEHVIRHNPFTLSGRRDVAAEADQPEQIVDAPEPIEAAVSAYLSSSRGQSAVIDGKVVRVGDIVDEDWYVRHLSPETAVLAPLSERASQR